MPFLTNKGETLTGNQIELIQDDLLLEEFVDERAVRYDMPQLLTNEQKESAQNNMGIVLSSGGNGATDSGKVPVFGTSGQGQVTSSFVVTDSVPGSDALTLNSQSGGQSIVAANNGFTCDFIFPQLTNNRAINVPDADGAVVLGDGSGVVADDFREAIGASTVGDAIFTAQDSVAVRDIVAPFPGPFASDGQAKDWGVAANRAYLGTDGNVHWVRGGTDPLAISDLTVAFDFGDADTLFTDDGVTPAGEGDAVKRIIDANGGALYLEQATGANRFTRNGSTLYPPAAPLGYSVSGSGIPFDWNSGTIVLIHGKRRTYTQVLSPATIYLDANYGAWASYASVRAHAGINGQFYVGGLYDDALNFWGGSFGAAPARFMSNSGTRTSVAWPTSGAVNLTKLFARTTDNFAPFNAPLRAIYFYNRALTEDEMASIREWFAIPNLDVVVQAIGDSITQGYVSTDISAAWPSRIAANRAWSIINSGLTSHRASQAVTDINWRTSLYETGKTNVALIWLGTNDMQLSSVAPATVWANLQSVCNSLKAAHPDWKIVLGTTLPRTDGVYTPPVGYPPGTTFDDVRDELNSSIRAGYAAVADGIADFAADPDIGANGASNSTAFFHTDKVHLNNNGQIRAAEIAQAAIGSIL